jgi:hypothetical protein
MEKSMERKYQYRNRTKDNSKKNSRRQKEIPINSNKTEDNKDKMRDVECYSCKKKGHYKKDCPTRDNNSDAESTRSYASTRSSASNIKRRKMVTRK